MVASTGTIIHNDMATRSCSISQAYSKFPTRRSADIDSLKESDPGVQLVHIDGTVFLEDYHRALLLEIIRRINVKSLRQYLIQHPLHLAPGDTDSLDPYCVAGYHGSTEALHMLLDHHTDRVEAVDKRGFLLLDRGASSTDTDTDISGEVNLEMKVRNSVLSLAISRGSTRPISRLLATGAQADAPKTTEVVVIGGSQEVAHNVTPVHIGALYSNFEALQVLLEHHNNLIRVTDSLGRLPLHWAAAGPGFDVYLLSKDDIALQVTQTLALLLDYDCNTINVLDTKGKTALHYVYAAAEPQQVVPGATLLGEKGADAGLRDRNGRTPLQCLIQSAMRMWDTLPEVELLKVMNVLVNSGAKTNDIDAQWNTPLHLAARNLGHVHMVKFLLRQGASASDTNAVDNTPVHEAARGDVGWISTDPEEEKMRFSAEFRIRKQDEMMCILLEAAGSEALLDRPNPSRPDAADHTGSDEKPMAGS